VARLGEISPFGRIFLYLGAFFQNNSSRNVKLYICGYFLSLNSQNFDQYFFRAKVFIKYARLHLGDIWPKLGDIWPKIGRYLAKIGRYLAKIGRFFHETSGHSGKVCAERKKS
jgi:hypothetical protein